MIPRYHRPGSAIHAAGRESFGVGILAEASESSVLERIKERLPPGTDTPAAQRRPDVIVRIVSAPCPGGEAPAYRLLLDGELVECRHRLSPLLDRLETDVRLRVGCTAPDHLFVHAGSVAFQDRAIIFPASSGSGKTTLTAALLREGCTYLSDEYAVVGRDGSVHAYPRPLSVRTGPQHRVGVSPSELDAPTAADPLPLGLVVDTRFAPHARWRGERISESKGVLALLAHTVGVQKRPAFAMETLANAVRGAYIVRSRRGEATSAARAIISLIASSR